MARERLTLEKVALSFAGEGYTVTLSDWSSQDKISFICPNGHHHSMRWDHFRSGKRCGICFKADLPTYEKIQKAFIDRGFTLLSKSYKGSANLLKFICPNGHKHQITWNNFSKGVGCGKCKGYGTREPKRLSYRVAVCSVIKGKLSYYAKNKRELQVTYSRNPLIAKIVSNLKGLDLSLYGQKGVHLDHIVPSSWFEFRNEEEALACWSVDNLRYIEERHNETRQDRLTLEELKQFTQSQIEILRKASKKPQIATEWLERVGI